MQAHSLVQVFLAVLAVANLVWILLSGAGDPDFYVFVYGLAWYFGTRQRRYLLVLLVAVLCIGLHTHSILVGRTTGFSLADRALLYVNLILPVFLIFAAWKAMRESRSETADAA